MLRGATRGAEPCAHGELRVNMDGVIVAAEDGEAVEVLLGEDPTGLDRLADFQNGISVHRPIKALTQRAV